MVRPRSKRKVRSGDTFLMFSGSRLVYRDPNTVSDEQIAILGEYGKRYGGSRWSVMGFQQGQIRDFRTRRKAEGFAKDVKKLGWDKAFEKWGDVF